MAMNLTDSVTLCTHQDELEAFAVEWRELHSRSLQCSPFLDFEYVILWYHCFARPEDVRVFRVVDTTGVVGFLPMVMCKQAGVRCLSNLTNSHCFHGDPLVLGGSEAYFARSILNALRVYRSWDLLHHGFTYSFSQMPGLFSESLLRSEGLLWEKSAIPTYLVHLNKPFDEYFRNDVSVNARKNYQKKSTRLINAGKVKFSEYTGKDALAFWPDFLRIENSGWKGDGESSIARLSENYRRYYEGLVKLLSERGQLLMYALTLDGKPIAGGFGYREGSIFHYAKAGYDASYKDFSPSNILLVNIIKQLMCCNMPEISILHNFPWDYNYKHRYCSAEECVETRLYNRTVRASLLYLFQHAKTKMKQMWNSLGRVSKGEC